MSKEGHFGNLWRHVLVVIGVVGLAVGLTALVPSQKVSADACSINGRDCYFGYFFNGFDGGPGVLRNNVIRAPALMGVNNATDLANTLSAFLGNCPGGALWNQNDQNATGAAFIILTMLGAPPGTPKNEACRRFVEWRDAYLFPYEAAGLINFNIVQDFGGINTRSTRVDVAYYPQNGAAPSIVFYSPTTGLPIYAIKKDCGNPIGHLQALFINYNLQADIVPAVNGAPPVGSAEPGDTISFSYRVINNSSMNSPVVNCTARTITHPGYFPTPGVPEGGGTNVPTSCPRSFPRFSTTVVANHSVGAGANTTVCATFFVSPANPPGATSSREVCVPVASKPYLKVYGGDVSVGGGLESAPGSCTTIPAAGAVSWNRKTAGHPGAGTQFAALATGLIREFATAQGNAGGAPAGAGLAFANTVNNPGLGQYGGNLGTVSCARNFYDYSGGAPAFPNSVTDMNPSTPIYAYTGTKMMDGGNVNPNQRTTVYVDGDLYIRTNINYVGSWNVGTMPMLKFVVQGNIYIDNDVTNLDGIYIAQRKTGVPASGSIYTCTTSAAIPAVAAGSFYNNCTNKLTVNGAFIAHNVEFLRTRGTQRASTANEASASANIAEVFNYSPAFWIPQPLPTGGGTTENYDSIISLPPVL